MNGVCGAGEELEEKCFAPIKRPSQRRELAEKAVAQRGVGITLACRSFGVSETCYRYSPQRNADNEIADLLLGLVIGDEDVGFRPLLPAYAQCPRTSLEPQTRLPHREFYR